MERPRREDGKDLLQAPCVRFAAEGAITEEHEHSMNSLPEKRYYRKESDNSEYSLVLLACCLAEGSAALSRGRVSNLGLLAQMSEGSHYVVAF